MRAQWQCHIDFNAQKENSGSMIRFCNLASSVEIMYVPIAIEPRRFGKHKIYHIIPQEMRKQSLLAAAVQIHDVTDKNEHLHLQGTPYASVSKDRGQGIKLSDLKFLNFH